MVDNQAVIFFCKKKKKKQQVNPAVKCSITTAFALL
jgi:hypothetical protein